MQNGNHWKSTRDNQNTLNNQTVSLLQISFFVFCFPKTDLRGTILSHAASTIVVRVLQHVLKL